MADSTNIRIASTIPQSTTRRNLLTAGAAAIGGAAVAVPSIASAVAGEDPIFAALAEWRRLNAAHDATPEDTAERRAALDALIDFERETLFPLKPTSTAGIVAMLKFVSNPRIAFNMGEEVSAVIDNTIEFLVEREARA